MPDISRDRDALRRLLESVRRIAVVGCSPNPARDSHSVAQYLIDAGYDVVPVNPGHDTLLGRPCYHDLRAVPGPLDLVDVFRGPEHVPAVVEDAIAVKAGAIWLQLGVAHADGVRRALEAGLPLVVEQCIRTAHQVLRVPRG